MVLCANINIFEKGVMGVQVTQPSRENVIYGNGYTADLNIGFEYKYEFGKRKTQQDPSNSTKMRFHVGLTTEWLKPQFQDEFK